MSGLSVSSVSNAVRAQLGALAESKASILSHAESAWSSITFAGTRHELVLKFEGVEGVEAGERLIAALPDHEFSIVDQLVADACVRATDHRFGEVETLCVTCVLLLLEAD